MATYNIWSTTDEGGSWLTNNAVGPTPEAALEAEAASEGGGYLKGVFIPGGRYVVIPKGSFVPHGTKILFTLEPRATPLKAVSV